MAERDWRGEMTVEKIERQEREAARELAIEWGVCLDGHVVNPLFGEMLLRLLGRIDVLEDRVRHLEEPNQ